MGQLAELRKTKVKLHDLEARTKVQPRLSRIQATPPTYRSSREHNSRMLSDQREPDKTIQEISRSCETKGGLRGVMTCEIGTPRSKSSTSTGVQRKERKNNRDKALELRALRYSTRYADRLETIIRATLATPLLESHVGFI